MIAAKIGERVEVDRPGAAPLLLSNRAVGARTLALSLSADELYRRGVRYASPC
jgi:hypothetical protein